MPYRRLHQLILLLYAVAVLGSAAMVVGPVLNDRAIAANPGRALATVTDVGLLRTTVDFPDDEGVYHSPPTGLLYPTGLGEGQRVWVSYDRTNPDVVKVEGREWTLAVIPALSVWAVASLVAAGAWWLLRRHRQAHAPAREEPCASQ
ncbi:DUF3592 domain-containing protein [Corynebacterium lizhenjunii]|uniref:DUF3592 domain-containing protein n=1 Tax=Corynebacterium lizhenjunii TaxID=2709394 RepID=A0A7T0PBJ9_9CORY|nr:DUF3592 domain-containing protein [Corynebacterium lizhenjunii]QPK80251.1 DUF3592 domain-containing protein [Corynebacterium lizhenjunii]